MILREPSLPSGWYPREKGKIADFIKSTQLCDSRAPGAIAPHAGWYYSGAGAAMAVSSLDSNAETVAVIGGHLPQGMPVLLAGEDGVKTPLGTMKIDGELREKFKKLVSCKSQVSCLEDRRADNTVEVLLPMVHYFFPRAELLWLRFPAEIASFEAGKLLAEAAFSLGRRLAVVGSADLTHYGANYGFSPKGRGKAALEWVKNVNDAAFISAVLAGDPSLVLERAEEDNSCCSAGAVLGALGFASAAGKHPARLLDYRTSACVEQPAGGEIPHSFVGYAAISLGN